MISTRAKLNLYRLLYPIKKFHTQPNGERLYTHDEFMKNYQDGFKGAKGETVQTTSQGYTKDEVDAARKKGVDLANQFLGITYRTHHDKGSKIGEADAFKTKIKITDEDKQKIKNARDEGYQKGVNEQVDTSKLRNQILATMKAEQFNKILAEEKQKLEEAKRSIASQNADSISEFRREYFRNLYKETSSDFPMTYYFVKNHYGKFSLLYLTMLFVYYQYAMNSDMELESELKTYGENATQHLSRKETEKECQNLFAIKDAEQLQNSCKRANTYLQEMKAEMQARRQTGYGDQRYFGNRYLKGIYHDENIQAQKSPSMLADKIKLMRK